MSQEYIDYKHELDIKCPKGHIYKNNLKNFKNGTRCPICRRVQFCSVIERAEENGYKVLSQKEDFINGRSLVTLMCKEGHISKKRYDNFHQKCKECITSKQRNDYEYVKNYIEKEGFKLLDKNYKNNSTKLSLVCNNGHNFNMSFSNFKQGYRCKECTHNRYRNKYEDVKKYVESRGYTLLSTTYKNLKEKLHLRCKNGHDYNVSFASFKFVGNDCPICNKLNVSKGEFDIMEILDKNNIEYISQFKFKDCRDKNELPFDFYIPSKNLIIEFDGIQHYKNKFGEESFNNTIFHDAIKNSYCEDNNIKLIRIPYWELKNIEKILTQHIFLE